MALALANHIRPQAEAGVAHSLRISKRCQAFLRPLRILERLASPPVLNIGLGSAVPERSVLQLASWPDTVAALRSLVVSLTRAVVLFNFLNLEHGFSPWWSTDAEAGAIVNELDDHLREQYLALTAEADVLQTELHPAMRIPQPTAFSFLSSPLTSVAETTASPPTPVATGHLTSPLLLPSSAVMATPNKQLLARTRSELPPLVLSPVALHARSASTGDVPASVSSSAASVVAAPAPPTRLTVVLLPPRPTVCVGRDDILGRSHKHVTDSSVRHVLTFTGDAGSGMFT